MHVSAHSISQFIYNSFLFQWIQFPNNKALWVWTMCNVRDILGPWGIPCELYVFLSMVIEGYPPSVCLINLQTQSLSLIAAILINSGHVIGWAGTAAVNGNLSCDWLIMISCPAGCQLASTAWLDLRSGVRSPWTTSTKHWLHNEMKSGAINSEKEWSLDLIFLYDCCLWHHIMLYLGCLLWVLCRFLGGFRGHYSDFGTSAELLWSSIKIKYSETHFSTVWF